MWFAAPVAANHGGSNAKMSVRVHTTKAIKGTYEQVGLNFPTGKISQVSAGI